MPHPRQRSARERPTTMIESQAGFRTIDSKVRKGFPDMSTRQSGSADPFGARASLSTMHGTTVTYYRLAKLVEDGVLDSIDRLPFTVRILLENVLRNAGGEFTDEQHVDGLAKWQPQASAAGEDFELPFL